MCTHFIIREKTDAQRWGRQGNRAQLAPVLIGGTKMNRLLNISKVTNPGPCLPDSKALCSPVSRHNMVAQGLANYSPESNSAPACELRVFIFLKGCQKKSKMYMQSRKHSLPALYGKSLLTPALPRGETLMEEHAHPQGRGGCMRFGAQSTPLGGVSQLCLVQGPGAGRGAGPGSPVPDVSTGSSTLPHPRR